MSHENPAHHSTEASEKTANARAATDGIALTASRTVIRRAQADPNSLTRADVLRLQRSIGNRATGRLLAQALPVQAKLQLGPANDKYEQEADAVARQVVRRMSAPPVQRHDEIEEEIQAKLRYDTSSYTVTQPAPPKRGFALPKVQRHHGDDELAQAAADHGLEGGEVEASVAQTIQRAQGSGSALDPRTRYGMESAFGADFGGVRVHTDAQADTLNRSLNARAFTTGKDIFFRKGEYSPGSSGGQELLAHELTHTVQQGASAVQRQSESEHGHDCSCGHCSVQREMDTAAQTPALLQRSGAHEAGCGCPSCASIQRTPAADLQRQHDASCGCPSCASLQRKPDTRIQRYFAPETGEYEHSSAPVVEGVGRSVYKKEGLRVQTKIVTQPDSVVVQQAMRSPLVQRHSSWEHQLLGDVPPTQIAKIGAWQDLIKQTELEGYWGFRKPKQQEASINIDGVGTIKKGTIMHVIAQELQRLSVWQKNPPTGTGAEDKEKLYGKDPVWQVELVALPAPEGEQPLIITYGEMNTLADFYGDLETMKAANPESRRQIVQSVRQETFFNLKNIYVKLQDSLTDTEKKDKDVKGAQEMMGQNELYNQILGMKFSGAIGATDYISGKIGQAELLSGAQSTGAKGEANGYGATLGRNACHFVPESWHAWARYHAQAREHAEFAYQRRTKAQEIGQELADENTGQDDPLLLEEMMNQYHKEADEASNEAMLNNGFGDHYLQDSYASGHMLNKTQIMQWYVQYLDEKDEMRYFTDKNWQRVQQIAYRQPGIADMIMYDKDRVRGSSSGEEYLQGRNPQAVEDNQSEDWKDRFDALGLTIPSSLHTGSAARPLVEWWQEEAMQGRNTKSGGDLIDADKLQNRRAMTTVLADLLQDGVVLVVGQTLSRRGNMLKGKLNLSFEQIRKATFALRDEYVPKDAERFQNAQRSSQEGDDTQYQRMAASVTYGDYFEFMNSSFLQKSTNALHDTFCQGGLNVLSGDGQHVFKVYGDDAMFNAGSAAGVKDSATTANMSRDAILNIAKTGKDGGNTTQAILDRLPDTVRVDIKDDKGKVVGTSDTEIGKWHNPDQGPSLRSYCFKEVFPSMSWSLLQKLGPGAMSTLGHLSKDLNVHGSEAF